MWPFTCKRCKDYDELIQRKNLWFDKFVQEHRTVQLLRETGCAQWTPLGVQLPPLNTNLLVTNKDFTYFGFLYLPDGWDNTKRINMFNQDQVYMSYTTPDTIAYWLNIDLFKKEPDAGQRDN